MLSVHVCLSPLQLSPSILLHHTFSTLRTSPPFSLAFLSLNSHYYRMTSSSTSVSKFKDVSVCLLSLALLPPLACHDSSGPVSQWKGWIKLLVMHDVLYLYKCYMSNLRLPLVPKQPWTCIEMVNASKPRILWQKLWILGRSDNVLLQIWTTK